MLNIEKFKDGITIQIFKGQEKPFTKLQRGQAYRSAILDMPSHF